MPTVHPNQVVAYTVEVFGAGGSVIPATLSAATLSVNGGGAITATVSGQTLTATVPAGAALGAGTLAWAWTQVAGGVTSAQAVTEAVTVAASGGALITGLITVYTATLLTPSRLPSGGLTAVKVRVDGDNPFTLASPVFLLTAEAGGVVAAFGSARVDGTTSQSLSQVHYVECPLNTAGLFGNFDLTVTVVADDTAGDPQTLVLITSLFIG